MKTLGIISVALTWTAIAIVLLGTSKQLSRSISHHAALRRGRYYLFAVIMTISVLLMYAFLLWWFIPIFMLSATFAALMSAIVILELITTWIPLTDGWKYKVHQTCSYGAALLIPIALFSMLASPVISGTAQGLTIAAIAVMAFLMCLFFFVKSVHRHYLIYQSLYVVTFHAALLAAVYII